MIEKIIFRRKRYIDVKENKDFFFMIEEIDSEGKDILILRKRCQRGKGGTVTD